VPDNPNDVESYLDPVPLNRVVRGGDKLQGVQPDLLNHWNNLHNEFTKAGLAPEIKSGYRTVQQQQALYNNPRTRALTKGNDGIFKLSPHQEGRALDISFPATQKVRGRQIIANYARANGLTVPSDEPWHIAIPGQRKQGVESYLDPQGAQQPQQPSVPVPVAPVAAPMTAKPNVEDYLDPQPAPSTPLKTPKTSVTLGEGAVDETQPKLAPIKFTPADPDKESNLNQLAKSSRQ
jgi:hypothetical protein